MKHLIRVFLVFALYTLAFSALWVGAYQTGFDRGYLKGFADAGPLISNIDKQRDKVAEWRNKVDIPLKNMRVHTDAGYAALNYKGEVIIGEDPRSFGVWRDK